MKRYKVQLVAKLVGFCDVTVEADSEVEAKLEAHRDGAKLLLSDWDVQYIEHYGDNNDIADIEVNEICEIAETHQ